MNAEHKPTGLKLAMHRAIATSKTQPIHDRYVAAQWIKRESPHETDHTLANAVLADLGTIAQIEVV